MVNYNYMIRQMFKKIIHELFPRASLVDSPATTLETSNDLPGEIDMTAALISRGTAVGCIVTILVIFALQPVRAAESSQPEPTYFTYEFYYKVKWGYFEEWMELYKKNHYPVLKRMQEMGHIVRMEAAFPIDHDGEADRWDMRFTVVYPDVQTAFKVYDSSAILEELYPDQETFKREEQRRFELLLEHKDVPIRTADLNDW